MSLIPSQVFSQVTYLSSSKDALPLLPRASKAPPNLATLLNPRSLRTPPCPSLSCPAEQEPQALPEQGLCCSSAPSPRLWAGSCPLLSIAPVCAFLACSSHQNLNFSLGFSKGKKGKKPQYHFPVACWAPLPMKFSRQAYCRGLPCLPRGDLPHPGIKPAPLASPAQQLGSLPLAPLGNPYMHMYVKVKVPQSCPTLRPCGLYSPWDSPGQNAGVGSLSLLQGIFPTQGLNPGLQHCRWILYHLSFKGSPHMYTHTHIYIHYIYIHILCVCTHTHTHIYI